MKAETLARTIATGLLFALFMLPGQGCRPRVGERCQEGKRACDDKTRMLVCSRYVWQANVCKGPKGCYEENDAIQCDVSANAEGDLCPPALAEHSACRADKKSRAICKDGRWTVELCKGPRGCTTVVDGSTCDNHRADLDDPCTQVNPQKVCSVDGKRLLECKQGKFVDDEVCDGKDGCKEGVDGALTCDVEKPKNVGDRCPKRYNGALTCSPDASQLLRCTSGKLVVLRDCPGPGRCQQEAGKCDSGRATVDTACNKDERACSDDGKSLLRCEKGKLTVGDTTYDSWTFKVERDCGAPGCTPKNGTLLCP